MKTNKLFAVAALLPVLFSCAKDEIRTNDNLSGDGQKYDFTITVSGDEDSITKASLSDADGIFWVGGGKAGIVKKDGENTVKYESKPLEKIYPYGPEEGPKYNQASFAFDKTYAGEYKFFYPYHSEATLDKIPFLVDPNQKTSAGSSADCFALVSDGMVSLTAENHDTPAETTYKVVGSYIRFLPFGKAGEKVKCIVIKGDGNTVSGRYFVNGNDNTLVSGVDYNAETITLEVLNDYTTEELKDNAEGLYTPVLPGNSKNTYTVITDSGFYSFASAEEKTFKFGSIKDIPLNLNNGKKTAPDALYVIGDATTAGWTAEKAIPLTKDGNKYIIENIPLIPGGEGFKFLTKNKKDDWSNALVNAGDNKLAYYVNVPNDKDIKFTVGKAGLYDLVVDFDDFTVTTTLKTEFPRVISNHKKNTYWMLPTGNDGEFKVSGVFIDAEDKDKTSEENANSHDFFILVGDSEAYNENGNFMCISSFDANSDYTYTADVTKNNSTGIGWWIKDDNNQTKRLYDITLNTNTNKVSVRFTQGKNFWLIGTPFGGYNAFNKPDAYKATADENGIVTWNVTTKNTGDWKICGENTLADGFWDGEWYFSTEDQNNNYLFNWNWDGGNNYYDGTEGKIFNVIVFCDNNKDQKWKFNETGDFIITFDSKNLKIKVEKLPNLKNKVYKME